MQTVVDFIDSVLMNIEDEASIGGIKQEVKIFMQQFPLYTNI